MAVSERVDLSSVSRLKDFSVLPDGGVVDIRVESGETTVDPYQGLRWAIEKAHLAAADGVSPATWPNRRHTVRVEGLRVISDSLPTLGKIATAPRIFGDLSGLARNAVSTLVAHGTPEQQRAGAEALERRPREVAKPS